MTTEPATTEPAAELEELRARLAAAEEALHAIRNGDVDAVVVTGARGEQVYALTGADRIYRQLIETMSEGAVALSADGVILWCNASLAKLLGRPLNQVLGTALRGYLPSAGQPALDAILAQARTETCRREINLTTSDGHLLPAYLSASRLQSGGAALVFCLVLTDLTEQRVQDLLRQSEARYRTLFEAISDGLLIADLETRAFSYANPAACRMFGYTGEELTTLGAKDLVPKDDVPSAIAEFEAHVRGDKAFSGNLHCIRKNGTFFYADVASTKFTIDDRTCIMGIFRDITARKQAKDAMRQQTDELRVRNAELARFNRVAVDRELRMVELKQEMNALCRRLGEPPLHATGLPQDGNVPSAAPAPAPPGEGAP